MSTPAVRLVNVTKRYGQRTAVDRVSLDVLVGESLVVVGPSGCGKTTMLRVIAGLEHPDEGEVWLDDRRVAAAGRNLVAAHKRRLGFVFQDLALWPHLTVRGNLAFVTASAGVPKAQRRDREHEILTLVRIAHLAERYPHELSGGEQQRAALARSLIARSQIVLLDEPFSSLDPDLRAALRTELARLQRALRLTTIYVTHDRDDAAVLADRIVEMRDGRILTVSPIQRQEAQS
jgi:iron(III) transport system ATP-binding protein